jgi:RNA polymerase sigma factor (sigma-70 family)
MSSRRVNEVLAHLRRSLTPPDGQLLARFVAAGDEAAFAALVRRHGPMVLGVCRRVLRGHHDAEDAFQATFLLLARKAASLADGDAVGAWLHGVAYRTALEARAANARRRAREKQVDVLPHPAVLPAEPQDWRPLLDRELSRLAPKYQAPVVLCDLQGQTRKEAARQLRLPEGTLSSRLATARRLLARRLARYGLSLSGGALATALTDGAAAVPAALVVGTVQAAAGPAAAVATPAILLMNEVSKAMMLTKVKFVVAAVMVTVALGASGLVYRASGEAAPVAGKPLNELDALRNENELLKLNLQVVLEKVRAQEAELRTLRARAEAPKAAAPLNAIGLRGNNPYQNIVLPGNNPYQEVDFLKPDNNPYQEVNFLNLYLSAPHLGPAQQEALRAAEDALKAVRQAPDPASQRRALEALDKAMKKLKEQIKAPPKRNP